MNANDKIRLRHMLQYARSARSFIKNASRQTVDEDEMLQFALVRALEVIGEAASKVTKETQNQLPRIRWAAIIGMRNVLIHGYVSIDLDIVWQTVSDDLPPLIAELEKLIPPDEPLK